MYVTSCTLYAILNGVCCIVVSFMLYHGYIMCHATSYTLHSHAVNRCHARWKALVEMVNVYPPCTPPRRPLPRPLKNWRRNGRVCIVISSPTIVSCMLHLFNLHILPPWLDLVLWHILHPVCYIFPVWYMLYPMCSVFPVCCIFPVCYVVWKSGLD